jgi:hypothetical protein
MVRLAAQAAADKWSKAVCNTGSGWAKSLTALIKICRIVAVVEKPAFDNKGRHNKKGEKALYLKGVNWLTNLKNLIKKP